MRNCFPFAFLGIIVNSPRAIASYFLAQDRPARDQSDSRSTIFRAPLFVNFSVWSDKQRDLTLLDIRGNVEVENNDKLAYVTCKLGEQWLVQMQTLPLSNDPYGNTPPAALTDRLVMEALKRHVPA